MVLIASYGGGTNSTAMLIECAKRGIQVDLILFADTGAEKPHTYEYVKRFSDWLQAHGMPEIITVQSQDKDGNYYTLEQRCVDNKMLPSIAYGFKACSEKHKQRPQNKYVNNWQPAKDEWERGQKVIKLIGFDADEEHRAKIPEDSKYVYSYPLVDWDMGRDECIETITEAGLCLPGKSACYFCPSSRPTEIRQLAKTYPELTERALEIEANAELTSVKGLGRNFAWRDLLKQSEMFDDDYSGTPEMVCGCYDG